MRKNSHSAGYERLQVAEMGAGAIEVILSLIRHLECSTYNQIEGKVTAVFDRTLHISLPMSTISKQNSLIVLGREDIRDGPLLLKVPSPLGFSFNQQVGDESESVTIRLYESESTLEIDLERGLTVCIDTAQIPTLPAAGGIYKEIKIADFKSGGELVKSNKKLLEYVLDQGVEDGLGLLTEVNQSSTSEPSDLPDQLTKSFSRILCRAKFGLHNDTPIEGEVLFQPVTRLIGRGPGATPSGDDLLIGIFLILQRISDDDLSKAAKRLCIQLSKEANSMTTRISSSLLTQVTKNRAAKPAVVCARTITEPASSKNELIESAEDLIQTGHTSGIDCLTGMLIATTLILPQLNRTIKYNT